MPQTPEEKLAQSIIDVVKDRATEEQKIATAKFSVDMCMVVVAAYQIGSAESHKNAMRKLDGVEDTA